MRSIKNLLIVLLGLALATAACSSSDEATDTTKRDGDSSQQGSGDDRSDSGGGSSGGGSSNPCAVITQEQWEAIFGDGVTKGEASGSKDNCKVLTSGSSTGHEISLSNMASMGMTSFDEVVTANRGCSGTPAEASIGDKAVVDSSCLEVSGRAWAVVESGDDILLVSLNFGTTPSGDASGIAETFTTVAGEIVDAR